MYNFRKIAVLRVSALGDFIFALPALTALKETYPDSEIYYLGKEWHQIFLAKRKSPVDRVIVVPPAAGVGESETHRNEPQILKEFYKLMTKEKFDLAVQLHGGGKYSNVFLLNLGARMTIGTRTENAAELTRTIPYIYYQNEYLRWIEVVDLVDAKTSKIMPFLDINNEDINEAKEVLKIKFLSKHEQNTEYRIVVLHPGATDLKRRWPEERFAQAGDYFADRGYMVVVTGSDREEESAVENVAARMRNKPTNLYGKLTINGLAGLLSIADLVISNDTGPLHLADALGSKTVGIYWCPNLINAVPPFRKNSICLGSWIIHCPLCGVDCATGYPFRITGKCGHETSFVAGVSVGEVIHAGEKLLSGL